MSIDKAIDAIDQRSKYVVTSSHLHAELISCKLSRPCSSGSTHRQNPPLWKKPAARNYLGFAMAKRTKKVGITGKYGTRDLAFCWFLGDPTRIIHRLIFIEVHKDVLNDSKTIVKW